MRINDIVDVGVELCLELLDLRLRHLIGVHRRQRGFSRILRRRRNSEILLPFRLLLLLLCYSRLRLLRLLLLLTELLLWNGLLRTPAQSNLSLSIYSIY